MLERWRPSMGQSRPFDVATEFMHLTRRLPQGHCSALCRARRRCHRSRITTLLNEVTFRFTFLLPRSRCRRPATAVSAARATLDGVIYGIIAERRGAGRANTTTCWRLMEARDEETERMSDKHLRDEVITLFLAGHETTANALTWASHLLSMHGGRIAGAEVDETLQGRIPTATDRLNLPARAWW